MSILKKLNEINSITLQNIKKNPLETIPPAGFTGKIDDKTVYSEVKDPLDIGLDAFIPTLDDAEIMLVSVIGCVPTVGPILQGVFTIFSGRFKEKSLSKEDVEKMIEDRLAKFKEEITKVIDEKIEKSEIDQYKKMCDKAFKGLESSSLELLMDDLLILKKKLKNNEEVDKNGSFMIGLRGKFDILRINIKAAIPLFTDKRFLPYIYEHTVNILFIYVMLMRNLMCYWYDYGFDPVYARGTPADENDKETHSYREKLHINIQSALKAMMHGLVCNQKGLENVNLLLESDPILYPIPMIRSPVVPSYNKVALGATIDATKHKIPIVNIDVNQRARPFIVRIDGINCYANPVVENLSGFERKVPSEKDPITDCYGFYLHNYSAGIKINLSEEKNVTIRLFILRCQNSYKNCIKYQFRYPLGNINLNEILSELPSPSPISLNCGAYFYKWDNLDYQSGCLNSESYLDPSLLKVFKDTFKGEAGFVQTKKFKCKEKELWISCNDIYTNLLFIEVVISD